MLATPFAPYATDLVFLQCAASLADGNWTVSIPLWVGTDEFGHPLLQAQDAVDGASAAFFRLEVHE